MKLKWYSDTESDMSGDGMDSAKVFRSGYSAKGLGSFDILVYPVSLINKSEKGWEYKLENEGEDFEYDAIYESSNGAGDHASTSDECKKWAENTLQEFIDKPEDMKGYRR
jgi:hypothetical protein